MLTKFYSLKIRISAVLLGKALNRDITRGEALYLFLFLFQLKPEKFVVGF